MKKPNKTAVALGNFDGLHRGHMRVLQSAVSAAERGGLTPVALLFDEHPMLYLTGKAPEKLLSDADKKEIFARMGIKTTVYPFSQLRDNDCAGFVKNVLCGELDARAVCCGFNYRFGCGGAGSADDLSRLCSQLGVETIVAPREELDGKPISSTRIRQALLDGQTKLANEMLGRSFSYCLPVIHGDNRGEGLGFPTINQSFPPGFLVPRYGVYSTRVTFDGVSRRAVTNIGVRPTVGGERLLSETHILGFEGDLYGRQARVELVDYLRGERSFGGFDELKRQIAADIAAAEKSLDNN